MFSLALFTSLFIASCERSTNNNEIKQNTEKDTVELPEELKAIMTKYRAEDKFIPKAPEDGSKMAKKLDSVKRSQKNTEETVKYIEHGEHQPRISLLPHTPETLKEYQDRLKELKESMTEAQQQMDSLNRAQQTNPENVNSGAE